MFARHRDLADAAQDQSLTDRLKKAAEGIEPLSDLHASARYRAAMAEVFARRALTEAVKRAVAGK